MTSADAVPNYGHHLPRETPRQRRARHLKKEYGITLGEYDRMLKAARGVCECCGQPPYPKQKLCVDHCHHTGKIRGLLCRRCNRAIGLLGDDITSLQRGIAYLRRSNK